jgi:hypothetical protein
MSVFNLGSLVGEYVSVMIDVIKSGDDTKESYIGKVEEVYDDYLVLRYDIFKTTDKSRNIGKVIFKRDHIVSFWIYKKECLFNLK